MIVTSQPRLLGILLTLAMLTGCSRLHEYHDELFGRPTVTRVVILDASGSVSADGWLRESEAVRQLVLATTERGDSITLLPVTEDADAEASGHGLTLQRSAAREICDSDEVKFQQLAAQRVDAFLAELKAQPGRRTDLLGAVRVATESLRNAPPNSKREVIVLSDFIQDANGLRFSTDTRLATPERAEELARTLAREPLDVHDSVDVFLGEIGSKELHGLSQERRSAIRSFWKSYMKGEGFDASIRTDGVGELQWRIERINAKPLPAACSLQVVEAKER